MSSPTGNPHPARSLLTAPRTDRRTVLRTAAWTTPAVVLASAAPAHATSSPGLAVSSGSTAIGTIYSSSPTHHWVGPQFAGLTIQTDTNLAANDLKVTLTATSPTTPAYVLHDTGNGVTASAAPWRAVEATKRTLPSLSFIYPNSVSAGTTVPLTDGGLAVICGDDTRAILDATLTVTVSATGVAPVVLTFTSPEVGSRAARTPDAATTSRYLLQH